MPHLSGLLSLFQDERDRQVNLVADDVAVLDQHVLVLDPSTLDVPEGTGGTLDGHVNRVLKALIGGGTQLCYASYAHKALLLRLAFPESFLPLKPRAANAKSRWSRCRSEETNGFWRCAGAS